MLANQTDILSGTMESKLTAKMSKFSLISVSSIKIMFKLTNTIIALKKVEDLYGFMIIFVKKCHN